MLKQYRWAAAKTCILFPKEKLSCSCFVPSVVDFVFCVCVCGFMFCSSTLCGVGVLFMWSHILAAESHLLLPCRAAVSFVPCGFMLWCHVELYVLHVMWGCLLHGKLPSSSCAVELPPSSCHVELPPSLCHAGAATFLSWSCSLPHVMWSCCLPHVELPPSSCHVELLPSSCHVELPPSCHV